MSTKAILVIFIVVSTVIALKISSTPSIYSHATQEASATSESPGKSGLFCAGFKYQKAVEVGAL